MGFTFKFSEMASLEIYFGMGAPKLKMIIGFTEMFRVLSLTEGVTTLQI